MNKEEILKNIKIDSVIKKGKVTIINKEYVIKDTKRNNDFFEYLSNRKFNNFPEIYSLLKNNVLIYNYIEENNVPLEQKIEDMTHLSSILHINTVFDKKLELDNIKEMYENIKSRIDSTYKYYYNLQDIIEEEVYMSPSNYLLIRNISYLYKALKKSNELLDNWFNKIKDTKNIRYSYIHGNLSSNHIIESNNLYLISWDKSRIDYFIYDIEILYRNEYRYIDLNNLFKIYEKKNPLLKEEKELLLALILIPDVIEFKNKNEYMKTSNVTYMFEYIKKTLEYLENNSKESNNNTNK